MEVVSLKWWETPNKKSWVEPGFPTKNDLFGGGALFKETPIYR